MVGDGENIAPVFDFGVVIIPVGVSGVGATLAVFDAKGRGGHGLAQVGVLAHELAQIALVVVGEAGEGKGEGLAAVGASHAQRLAFVGEDFRFHGAAVAGGEGAFDAGEQLGRGGGPDKQQGETTADAHGKGAAQVLPADRVVGAAISWISVSPA